MLAVVALVLIGAGISAMKKYQMPLPTIGGVLTVVPKMSLLTVGGILIIALELWLIWAIIGNPFSNPAAFVGTLIILGATNIGLYHIYKAASAKVTVYIAFAVLVLGGILGFVAVASSPESANQLLSWGRNGVTESVDWLTGDDSEDNRVGIFTGRIIRLVSGQPLTVLMRGEKKVYPGACHKISINAAEGAIETNWDHIPAGYGIIIAKKLTEVTLTAIRDTKYPGC